MLAVYPLGELNPSVRKRNAIELADGSRCDNSKRQRPNEGLCDECQRYDFQGPVNLDAVSLGNCYDGFLIANVGTRFRKPIQSRCPLCHILSASRIDLAQLSEQGAEAQQGTDEIRAFHFLKNFDGIEFGAAIRKYEDSCLFFLAVVPAAFKVKGNWSALKNHMYQHGYVVCYEKSAPLQDSFAVQVLPAQFDPSGPQSWLQYCKDHHKKLCSRKYPRPKGLKLLDCSSLTVGNATDQDSYIALSYVWGNSGMFDELAIHADSRHLPSVLPMVISDAIEVTKALGFQYLWVDKYCIDQSDHEAKHQQIQQMDSVYENSELTIIAAAGPDESYGLPGVGNRARMYQPIAETESMRILSTMPDPHDSILKSTWSTRGWTFQEGVLSRRRLVFTKEQVYFECKAMNCYESITCSLNELHTKDRVSMQKYLRAGIFNRSSREAFGGFKIENMSPLRIYLRYLYSVEQYSSRLLKFDQDSLNAFGGVIREYGRRKNPVSQLWGVPYMDLKDPDEAFLYFHYGLTWKHTNTCWDDYGMPRRRSEFPSWSWAGWSGGAVYFHEKPKYFESRVRSLTFEQELGPDLYFSQTVGPQLIVRLSSLSPRIICLQARIVPPTAFLYDGSLGTWRVLGFPAELILSQGPASAHKFAEELKYGEKWQCIFWANISNEVIIMVLEPSGEISYRAGLFTVASWYFKLRERWDFESVDWVTIRIA